MTNQITLAHRIDHTVLIKMKRKLGNTDIELFPIGLGAMPLGIRGHPPLQDSIDVIHCAVDAGINFIDTANVYCTDDRDIGLNERTIAQALKSINGNDIVVATKGGLIRPQGRWERRGSPQHLRRACEQSLKDLNVAAITLYQLHAPDPQVPFVDSVGELARLQSEGKILHVGLSNVGQDLLEQAINITTIVAIQNRCNIFYRDDLTSGFVDYCHQHSITYIAYSPMGGGGRHTELYNISPLTGLAVTYETTVYQIVLAWLLQKCPNILPIPGASRMSSAISSAHAVHVQLSNHDVRRIDEINTMATDGPA